MNDLQRAEFELLKQFVGVCEQLGLKYYLVCGTALGAVKYRGFIPWDDDVDVALPRKDYEIFVKKAQALLPENVFVQNYRTDPSFPQIFTKLRDSNTAYIEKSVAHLPINHGIYIDVFPLDGYPEAEAEKKKLERKKRVYQSMILCSCEWNRGAASKIVCSVEHLLGCHKRTAKTADKFNRAVSAYSAENSAIWCNHGNWQGELEYAPREQYGEGEWAEFEGLRVRVPQKSDEYLTQKYGNWRADLPEDEQVGHHFCTVCDTQKSYKEYIN